jgi:hypothetical protein
VPGRVPVIIESDGPQQMVSESIGSMMVSSLRYSAYGTMARTVYRTPCALYLRPGLFSMITGGPGVRQVATQVDIPPTGVRLRMYAPSAGQYLGGVGLAAGGITVAVIGIVTIPSVAFLAAHYDTVTFSSSPNWGTGVLVGGIITGVGVAMIIGGIFMLKANHGGIESAAPLRNARAQPRVPFAADLVPTHGGALASATFRF